ncbi:multidrug efflux pump subunit AcrA (membrane-fusion protein) [Kineococcus xinjiangensis]|uniref:Multidrug efflux pump subunit AcrA (Membrane-fusion protein) n=1 Tax=Kineococcus xinjiangensis TaxID=512762 RepID=A0A2S6ISH8_9ACTN|nr:efflux RND transporter periplasmic adaptor subunit [Kineococcus xinjiangensis]PPK97213.1 multidrug efflux pump subunit AcrA (membrane-fusion protein) [Kineococcus xinjiangensis]
MGTVRTIVFPVLRLLLLSVIAVCLVYLAFFRGAADAASDPAVPSVNLAAPEATVTRADVVNTVTLSGSITEDAATTVKSTAAGTVGKLRVAVGDPVAEGDPLFTVVVPVEEDPAAVPVAPDPAAPPAPAPKPKTKTVTVKATVPGVVETLDVLPQQNVEVGGEVATISPGTLRASAALTQADQFRLLEPPTFAEVTVPGGPGSFACTDLRTGRPEGTGSQDSMTGGYSDPYADPSASPTGASLTCLVPEGVQVFAGATATIEVTAGEARGVLVAPVTAVKGTVGTGSVWVLHDTAPEGVETPVTLGLTDGENVEIRSGLEEGARILQFVPTSDEILQDPSMMDPGMMGYGG